MAKLLVFVIALATLGFLGYHAMYNTRLRVEAEGPSAPKQQLDNVRKSVNRSAGLEQKRLDGMEPGAP